MKIQPLLRVPLVRLVPLLLLLLAQPAKSIAGSPLEVYFSAGNNCFVGSVVPLLAGSTTPVTLCARASSKRLCGVSAKLALDPANTSLIGVRSRNLANAFTYSQSPQPTLPWLLSGETSNQDDWGGVVATDEPAPLTQDFPLITFHLSASTTIPNGPPTLSLASPFSALSVARFSCADAEDLPISASIPLIIRSVGDVTAPVTQLSGTCPPSDGSRATAVRFESSDDSGLAGFECSLDSAEWARCSSPHAIVGLATGTHQVRVRARDTWGNIEGSPLACTWNTQTESCNLRVSGGPTFTQIDAQLVMRYLLGIRGTALVDGLVETADAQSRAQQIADYLATQPLDFDGDGVAAAATDGLLLLRAAQGVTGPGAIINATAPEARRFTWEGLRAQWNQLCALGLP